MLETEIKKLTAAIEALTAAMGHAPKADAPKADAPKAIPIDELTRLCLGLSRDGHRDAIKSKLADMGAGRISELKGDDYTIFADWAVSLAERAEPSQ